MNRDPNPAQAAALPIKLLLVDDLDENLLALSALLRADDVVLLTARSGREALELLLVHDVALAVVDVQMPEMDGFQLAELMRGSERTRQVPIIFVTAGTNDQRRQFEGYQTGAVDFLFKPIEPHVLKSKADVFIRLHRQQQLLARELRDRTETLRLSELFTAMLGHDLRGPLSTIQLSARMLDGAADDASRRAGERIARNAKLMNRMIADMLDLARTRLGQGIVLARQDLDLGLLVEQVVQERQLDAADHPIRLARAGDLTGHWDADRLVQVASNLVSNALKHGAAHQPIDVRLDGTRRDAVLLSVANTGVIPADVRPHIFDPFRAGRSEGGRNDGLGLGLYIVRQILDAHGADIEVGCDGGGHTEFRAVLPRR